MKNKIIAVLAILLTVAGISIYFGYNDMLATRNELREAQNNVKVLEGDVTHYKTLSGKNASTVEALQYTLAEMKRYRAKDIATIEDLNVKLKRAQYLINIGTETKVKYVTVMKDSIIRDTVVQCFDYSDAWVDSWGCVKDKVLDGGIAVRDTVSVVGEPTYRRVWIFFKKVNGAKISVVNKNPYSTIVSNEYFLFR